MNTRIIDKAFFGSTSVIKLYQGSELVWPILIPGIDASLEYISNGEGVNPDDFYTNQPDVYYDTGVIPSLNTKVEIMYEWEKLVTNEALFGVGDYLKYGDSISDRQDERTYFMFLPGTWKSGFTPSPVAMWGSEASHIHSSRRLALPEASFGTPHVFTMYYQDAGTNDKRIVGVLDGSTYYASDSSLYFINVPEKFQSSYSGPGPTIFLFATNCMANDTSTTQFDPKPGFASRWSNSNTKIYYVKIYENDILIRDMVPILHWVGNTAYPCFYDKVNSQYYYNLGNNTPSYKLLEEE